MNLDYWLLASLAVLALVDIQFDRYTGKSLVEIVCEWMDAKFQTRRMSDG